MASSFNPIYVITPSIANNLMRIEAAKQKTNLLPLNPTILSSLRETAKLYTTHYSTMIEGNQLTPEEIKKIISNTKKNKTQEKKHEHLAEKTRDEKEVKGYYAALAQLEHYANAKSLITEKIIQTLHALVISDGLTHIKPTPYRDGQNVIRNSTTKSIVYMPPEAHDVPPLMKNLVTWIQENTTLPCPIVAAIAHYQLATIHPYYDGNGRTCRLLTTLILHLGGYDLKGLYSLEEYYAKNLLDYYQAISIGPSHNYYQGRAESDITKWIEYFLEGMAIACENVVTQMTKSHDQGKKDFSKQLKALDPKQRKALTLFKKYDIVTSKQIGMLFGFQPRTSAALCKKWVESNFLIMVNPSLRARTYALSQQYRPLLDD